MTSKELQGRLIKFAVNILKLFRKMPKEPDAIHIAGQFMRSGTHPGIHYGEARAAESGKDFVHKLKMINKELRETYNSLTIVQLMEYVKPDDITPVHKECNELIAIFTAAIMTLESKENRRKRKSGSNYLPIRPKTPGFASALAPPLSSFGARGKDGQAFSAFAPFPRAL